MIHYSVLKLKICAVNCDMIFQSVENLIYSCEFWPADQKLSNNIGRIVYIDSGKARIAVSHMTRREKSLLKYQCCKCKNFRAYSMRNLHRLPSKLRSHNDFCRHYLNSPTGFNTLFIV